MTARDQARKKRGGEANRAGQYLHANGNLGKWHTIHCGMWSQDSRFNYEAAWYEVQWTLFMGEPRAR